MKQKNRFRWDDLTEREQRIAILYCVEGKKSSYIYEELGIEKTQFFNIVRVMYIRLDVRDQVDLAFQMGRHWRDIIK